MTLKELVQQHLAQTFERESWQVSLSMAVDGLNALQAGWRAGEGRHTIWQTVRHVTHWKRYLLELWDGRRPDPREWGARDWAAAEGDEAAWQKDLRELKAVSQEIVLRVAELDVRALGEPFADWGQPLAEALVNMGTHDIYHAGQIRLLRALQGE